MRLFRDDPTRVGQWIMDGRQKVPGLRFLIPFARTPDRLIAFGAKRSPLGLLDYPMWKRLVAGNPEAVDELAATLMGSSVAMAFGSLVATGRLDITGAAPTEPGERDAFYRAGKQPFSVKFPSLGYVQFSQIPGLDTALTSLAAAKEAVVKGESPDTAIAGLGADIASNLFSRSYLSGVSDFIEIFSGGGYGTAEEKFMRWAGRQATGAVPFSAALRQGNQYFDRTIYDPEGIKEELATGLGFGGVAGVNPRLTAFGEESQRAAVRAPVVISPENQLRVDKALEEAGVVVTFVGDSVASRKLTTDQQHLYQRAAGRATYERLYNVVSSPLFRELTPVQKAEALTKAKDKGRAIVQDQIGDYIDRDKFKALPPATQDELLTQFLEQLGAREERGDEVAR